MMSDLGPLRTIGRITGAHGIQGDVLVKPYDDEPRWVGKLRRVFVYKNKGPEEMAIQNARNQQGRVIVRLSAVSDRNTAELLKGFEIKAYEAELPDLEKDEYYADQLIGYAVKSQDSGDTLGTIQDVVTADVGDFLEVASESLAEPVLVPFQTVFVPDVDNENRVVFVTGLDSLFKAE
jgi:16S rRNA processing protein RimM